MGEEDGGVSVQANRLERWAAAIAVLAPDPPPVDVRTGGSEIIETYVFVELN